MQRVKVSELEEVLLVLSLHIVKDLLRIFADILETEREVEVVGRAVILLLKIHHGPLVASEVRAWSPCWRGWGSS